MVEEHACPQSERVQSAVAAECSVRRGEDVQDQSRRELCQSEPSSDVAANCPTPISRAMSAHARRTGHTLFRLPTRQDFTAPRQLCNRNLLDTPDNRINAGGSHRTSTSGLKITRYVSTPRPSRFPN